MASEMSRRRFLAAAAAAAAGSALGTAEVAAARWRRTLKKALIVDRPTADNLRPMKEAGFHGVEAGIVGPEQATEARRVAEGLGMRVHSVLRGWAQFNSDQAAEVERSFETTVAALRAAQAYGADAILLVPGRLDAGPMPQPWEFHVRFDSRTGHLTAVVEEGNDRYRAYMEAHNRAHDAFLEAIRRLIPIARETRVVLAIENVWNNMYVDPRHLAHFVDTFKSRWVQVYLDLGNHVKYSPTEEWVRVLGKRIAKCHVKDFRLNPDGHGGEFVDIRDGSVNWPAVRRALDRVGYGGWMTIEGSGGLSLAEQSRRLDLICEGM